MIELVEITRSYLAQSVLATVALAGLSGVRWAAQTSRLLPTAGSALWPAIGIGGAGAGASTIGWWWVTVAAGVAALLWLGWAVRYRRRQRQRRARAASAAPLKILCNGPTYRVGWRWP
jgi:hypothetical protein